MSDNSSSGCGCGGCGGSIFWLLGYLFTVIYVIRPELWWDWPWWYVIWPWVLAVRFYTGQ